MLLPRYEVFSNNLRTKARVLKWSYDGTGLLRPPCCCVLYWFQTVLLPCCLLCLRDKPVLRVAGCTTATGVLLECQS